MKKVNLNIRNVPLRVVTKIRVECAKRGIQQAIYLEEKIMGITH